MNVYIRDKSAHTATLEPVVAAVEAAAVVVAAWRSDEEKWSVKYTIKCVTGI